LVGKINYKHHSIGSSIDIVNLFLIQCCLSIGKKSENSLIKMSVITDKRKIIEESSSNDLEKTSLKITGICLFYKIFFPQYKGFIIV
jgi:hypothetical protein